ncbi:phospholipase DDHD2 isoform X4 [Mycetomoellerius zeteki]|uniref:phospholipase DDHD2 isoform X4 n=1 Tax=Mycetomoellerius zeteki TaxID=64791 RepID=UPI00084EA744|nr:PREDICTED: phospholipase DDHD2-like isoform X4 [Trachymyrmex zeteki]
MTQQASYTELDNFIGQEPVNIQSQSPLRTNEDSSTNVSSQPKEYKDIANQPGKSGYLTSILSSLPNLSLSIKSDSSGPQISQIPENTSGTTHEPNPYITSQGYHGFPSETPGFLAINPQDSRSTNLSGFAAFPSGTVSNPPQPAAPPSISQPGYAPVSYRLGNQRRLKYAPPPDLTSNTAKPYPNPALQTFLSTQNVSAPPTILNPYESEGLAQGNNSSVQQTSCLPEQLPTSEQLSRNSSLHSSFRSSPIGTQYNSSVTSTNQNPFFESSSLSAQFPSSLSRPIPTRVLEPTTPQNTPANISFPGFAPYVNQDLPPTSNSDKEVAVIKNSNQLNSPPEFSKGSTLKTTIESTYKPTLISGETDATFTPISAAKVTEKLEHLLAEQQENSSVATPETLTEVDKTSSVTTELTKSFESQSDTLKATNEIINKSHEAKLNDVQEKAIQSGSDTWSDVFLGQESTTQSVIFPEIHTADNGLIAITPQSAKSNAHPPQQHYQVQSISMSSSTFYTDEPAEQKSSLNYVSPIQLPQQTSSSVDFYNVSKPTEQSASGPSDKRMQYRPVYHHWFYRKEVENKTLWLPFSMQDSLKLEEVHNSSDITPETTVATDGGRYDVDILRRERAPVYWTGTSNEVRRCSWFFKGAAEPRYVPYNESTAVKLEDEYKLACLSNNWNRRIELNNGEYIVFHSATVQVHYLQSASPDVVGSWGNNAASEDSAYLQGSASRPKTVKRGVDEFNIDEGEPEKVDHLLFLVHGIGSVCDLKFRTVEEVVDEFRSISFQLVQSHYRTACEQGVVNRIEVLPISWHTTLHSDTGIDKRLQAITLESIPKLRHFTNDTLLDILFYTSPIYCQTIMQTVGSELNRLYSLFKERNPTFDGEVFLGGHSLGSLIMFDLLCHQTPEKEDEDMDNEEEGDSIGPIQPMPAAVIKRRLSRKVSYVMGAAGTGQPYIHYPQLIYRPRAFFALGSPIGMFVTVRGIDTLGENFTLPTCPAFFNIFHPFDPVAYRVESLINPEASNFRPMLIPHHKGRKRMHLELKETMARVGADLKQKLIDSVRQTWNSFYQLALFHKPDNQILEREIDKVVEEQLHKPPSVPDQHNNDDNGANLKIGKLNGGRRIDYVLQEAPFEYINEYIFALTSHICYWESEDTMLLILKEIYGSKGIQTDTQLPQQSMSIERMSPSPSLNLASASLPSKSNIGTSLVMGVDPTVPMSSKPVGPPPKTGFVPKS